MCYNSEWNCLILSWEVLEMSGNENKTVLAVPCDQAIILNPNQAEDILGKIKEKRTTKRDKAKLEQDVKVLFTKPDKK